MTTVGAEDVVRPLTPGLYRCLADRFGRVTIANEGEKLISRRARHPSGRGFTDRIVHAGEYYRVNCPFCNDTRQRLWVNHCYGQTDQNTGYPINWLAHCYNEDCIDALDRRRQLEDMIFGFMNRAARDRATTISREGETAAVLSEVALPGMVVPLANLSPRHTAVRYLLDRGYDPIELSEQYGVGYCQDASNLYPVAAGRIIIPIRMDNVLVGWQARHPGDLNWKFSGVKKYYNLPGMAKRLMLYNFDRARFAGQLVVIVEGVTSVWSIGASAVALLGKNLSYQNQLRICHTWGDAGLAVVILDPDAADESQQLLGQLRPSFADRLFAVTLPPGKDPGDYTRDAIWKLIAAAGRAHGIDAGNFCA